MDNFFIIQKWMIKKLNLKGLERDLYAIIYGFTQDGESRYHGSLKYLSELTGYSKQSIITSLKKLCDKNLIIKHELEINGVKLCEYCVNFNGSKETLTGSQVTLTNNIDNNIVLNNKLFNTNITTPAGTNLYTFCINCIDDFCLTHKEAYLRENLIKYLKFRLEVKEKPLYKNMWKGLLEKLQNAYNQSSDGVKYEEIISVSIVKGYLTFYPITNSRHSNNSTSNNIHWKNEYSLDESEYKKVDEKF